MCTALSCRISATNSTCIYVAGIGAAEGTICDSGKVIYLNKPNYVFFISK